MTATEVAERHEEKMLMLGPCSSGLHNELLNPLIDITFDKMMEAGIVPPPPPELQGQELNVELDLHPRAGAARDRHQQHRPLRGQHDGNIAQAKPEVLDKFDADYWAETYSDMLGVDPKLIVRRDEVAQIRAQSRQQAASKAAAGRSRPSSKPRPPRRWPRRPLQGGSSTALDDALAQYSGYT
jgi:hypothetical protein